MLTNRSRKRNAPFSDPISKVAMNKRVKFSNSGRQLTPFEMNDRELTEQSVGGIKDLGKYLIIGDRLLKNMTSFDQSNHLGNSIQEHITFTNKTMVTLEEADLATSVKKYTLIGEPVHK